MTMSEKILAAHAGQPSVKPGDTVTCKVDWGVCHDMFFNVDGQDIYKNVTHLDHPEKCVIMIDHAVLAPTTRDAQGAVYAREFCKKHNIVNFFDVGDHAVIHQLLVERSFAAPGKLIAGGDSHTCAAGALNCAARGFGPADMTYVLCTGETWYQVVPTILYKLTGKLPEGCSGKDVFLYIAGVYGDVTGMTVEFGGEGVAGLTISQRQSIATMCAEINAEFAVFPCDDRATGFLKARGDKEIIPVEPDQNAEYYDVREVDLSKLEPYVAKPHFIPKNCVPVKEAEGLPIQQIVVGSCSNGRIEDLQTVADILKGKHIAPGVRVIVTPASQRIYLEAVKNGIVETLAEAGCVVTNASCGCCYGGHMGLIGSGERCLATTTRNFKGRLGSPDSEVMLCGPATAAASALKGVITDPRKI
ncbi:MAG: aconitase/3-isopropylmalate dehydratase large subunit family protein [Oscillospiraceae bacterium]|nr:aconitase/3-isopropylmalate dehydratase large subunit family protein [Oscillospiraceae bacterium]